MSLIEATTNCAMLHQIVRTMCFLFIKNTTNQIICLLIDL